MEWEHELLTQPQYTHTPKCLQEKMTLAQAQANHMNTKTTYTLGPRAEHTHALHWLLGQRMIFTAMFPKPSTELIGGRNITILVDWLPTNSLKVIKPASSFN